MHLDKSLVAQLQAIAKESSRARCSENFLCVSPHALGATLEGMVRSFWRVSMLLKSPREACRTSQRAAARISTALHTGVRMMHASDPAVASPRSILHDHPRKWLCHLAQPFSYCSGCSLCFQPCTPRNTRHSRCRKRAPWW